MVSGTTNTNITCNNYRERYQSRSVGVVCYHFLTVPHPLSLHFYTEIEMLSSLDEGKTAHLNAIE